MLVVKRFYDECEGTASTHRTIWPDCTTTSLRLSVLRDLIDTGGICQIEGISRQSDTYFYDPYLYLPGWRAVSSPPAQTDPPIFPLLGTKFFWS